eukprot:223202-Chlamydomonas_euryale.AAC.1
MEMGIIWPSADYNTITSDPFLEQDFRLKHRSAIANAMEVLLEQVRRAELLAGHAATPAPATPAPACHTRACHTRVCLPHPRLPATPAPATTTPAPATPVLAASSCTASIGRIFVYRQHWPHLHAPPALAASSCTASIGRTLRAYTRASATPCRLDLHLPSLISLISCPSCAVALIGCASAGRHPSHVPRLYGRGDGSAVWRHDAVGAGAVVRRPGEPHCTFAPHRHHTHTNLPVHPPHQPAHPSIHPPAYLSTHTSIHPSTRPSLCPAAAQ